MDNRKIIMKIGRYVKEIDTNDLILDNGACIQVTTQTGSYLGFGHYSPLKMSKKLFKDLKTCAFVYVDKEMTDKVNKAYDTSIMTYYRFDIDSMVRSGGYEVKKS